MKRTRTCMLGGAIAALLATGAMAEVNNGAFPYGGPYPPIVHITDSSECGDLNRPIRVYGNDLANNWRAHGAGDYLQVNTDRGWCFYSEQGIDNPIFRPGGSSEPIGESEGEGGEAK